MNTPLFSTAHRRWPAAARHAHWPLGLKIGLLNIGLCAALAIALTWLGTYRAIGGLQEQAEAALAADARSMADGVDGWHARGCRSSRCWRA